MTRIVRWRLHCRSSPATLFAMFASDAGRERFWAEHSTSDGDDFLLLFPDGTRERCTITLSEEPSRFAFTYFGSDVRILLEPDGGGGTDLMLINSGVPEADFEEVHVGWLSVLLPLKAAADFGVDLRNHDRKRTWRELYVDQ